MAAPIDDKRRRALRHRHPLVMWPGEGRPTRRPPASPSPRIGVDAAVGRVTTDASGAMGVPAVFWSLATVRPGDELDVTTQDGQVLAFIVVTSERPPRTPTQAPMACSTPAARRASPWSRARGSGARRSGATSSGWL